MRSDAAAAAAAATQTCWSAGSTVHVQVASDETLALA